MIVHKLLFGEGAATYLPFALSRLRYLHTLTPNGFFSQTFNVDDATINVRQVGFEQYLTITMGGGFYFEYATSALPVKVKEVDTLPGFNYYDSLTVATDVAALNGNIVTKPYVRENDRGWTSRVGFIPQIQLVNEPPRYRQTLKVLRNKYFYPNILYSSYAPQSSHTGVGLREASMRFSTFSFVWGTGGWDNVTGRDVFFDMPWEYGEKFQNPPTTAYLQDSADWPRESGYQTVVDDRWGTRSFAITIDAFCRFHVHPISAIGAVLPNYEQNVTPEQVRHVTPALPTWAFVPATMARDYWTANPNLAEWCIDQPEYQWMFNHTGTRACAVVYGRSEFNNDDAFFTDSQNPDTPWTQTKFDTILKPILHNAAVFGLSATEESYNDQRYFIGSGIVEAVIKITLTGTEANDFSVEITINEIRDPNTSEYSAMFAGYVWKDITKVGVEAGDLIAVDFEGYGQAVFDQQPTEYIMSVKNITKGTEAFTTRAYPIVALDISTLSFVLKLNTYDRAVPVETPKRVGGSETIEWMVEKFAMWVIHSGLSKSILYPETMPDEWKEELADLAVREGREFIDALVLDDPNWVYIPLANPNDGWGVNAEWDNYRDWWSKQRLYWYNEPWVENDPDWNFYGSGYPDEGYVRYRLDEADPPAWVNPNTPYEMLAINEPPFGSTRHLMMCDNPKWGWNFYAGVMQTYNLVGYETTFFTHPNGTYCFYSDHFIFSTQGMPCWGADSPTSGAIPETDPLSIFDVDQLEHCIFDRVHLEVKKAVGTSASLETSFLELYNRAVQKGLDEHTLADEILPMSYADIRGTFEKHTTMLTQCVTGEFIQTLDLKFTWRGKEWWWNEPGITGTYSSEPTLLFPPAQSGSFIGLNLMMLWNTHEYDGTFDLHAPAFVDMDNPNALPIRFCNAILITG